MSFAKKQKSPFIEIAINVIKTLRLIESLTINGS